MLRIVTWNVNSIRSRLTHLLDFIQEFSPDILLLQETKIEDALFPREPLEEAGYNLALHGQKTYNGVAILSKLPLEDVVSGLPEETVDQARYIEAVVSLPNRTLRLASVYVPNGQSVDSEKFPYKLNFMQNLKLHTQRILDRDELLVMGGDYNVAPAPLDVYDPQGLDGTVCYHPAERERFRALLHLGMYDAYRCLHPEAREYSWWDYRQNSLARGHGMRIDHLLLSAPALDRLENCVILKEERSKEKPSDHAPVMCSLAIG